MIPTIGVMMGVYIIFRCLEIACRSKSSFLHEGARAAVIIAATLGILVTGWFIVSLWSSSSGLPTEPPSSGASTGATSVETCRDPHESHGSSGLCWCDTGYKRDPMTQKCVKE